jgi:hypothetical protein
VKKSSGKNSTEIKESDDDDNNDSNNTDGSINYSLIDLENVGYIKSNHDPTFISLDFLVDLLTCLILLESPDLGKEFSLNLNFVAIIFSSQSVLDCYQGVTIIYCNIFLYR